MAAISGFLTAFLKIQDGGQTIELKEHRVYMNLKSNPMRQRHLYCAISLNSYTFYYCLRYM